MQTIKGLIALLLVAAGVFTAVVILNSKTEPGHDTVAEKAAVANTDTSVKHNADADTHRKNEKPSL